MKQNVTELEASRTQLQHSVAEAAERNKELNASVEGLQTAHAELAARNDESVSPAARPVTHSQCHLVLWSWTVADALSTWGCRSEAQHR